MQPKNPEREHTHTQDDEKIMTEGNCQIVLGNKNLNREIVVSMMNRITIVIDQMATLSVMTEYVLCRGGWHPPVHNRLLCV